MVTALHGRGLESQLATLKLAGLPLGSSPKMLGRLLPQMTYMVQLDLSNCGLGDKGTATVAAAGFPATLTSLHLGSNNISASCFGHHEQRNPELPPSIAPSGHNSSTPPLPPHSHVGQVVGPLTAALLQLPALNRLFLSSNAEIGDQGSAVIATMLLPKLPSVTNIELRGCGIGERGLRLLASALAAPSCAICTIDLAGNPFVGTVAGGIAFGNSGRGPLFRFDELLLRR
eukprot:SAG31_NODE_8539_length_1433_cov_1.520240_1_plen_230_part_00